MEWILTFGMRSKRLTWHVAYLLQTASGSLELQYFNVSHSQAAARRSERASEVFLDMCSTRTSPQPAAMVRCSRPTRNMTTLSNNHASLLGCIQQDCIWVCQARRNCLQLQAHAKAMKFVSGGSIM